jgi:hypothetical protein
MEKELEKDPQNDKAARAILVTQHVTQIVMHVIAVWNLVK